MRHKHADLIIAWANGAEIQFRAPATIDEWIDCTEGPQFLPHYEYRIKPEPKPDVVLWGRAELDKSSKEGDVKNLGNFPSICLGDNLMLTFDGETGKLKSAEVI